MRNVWATHGPHTSHTRVMHGLIYAPHGPVGMVVRVFITPHAVRTGPNAPHDAPTCALQIPKSVLIGFCDNVIKIS